MIAAICGCRNEADILERSLRHTLAEGADWIYITDACSDDGSREIIDSLARETGRITVLTDDGQYLHQAYWMNTLAGMAGADGATWIWPFDIDEFFYALSGGTVADALRSCDAEKVLAPMYLHFDWNTRSVKPKPLSKVVFPRQPDAYLAMGQHEVSVGGRVATDVLALREWQFRSFDHYLSKVRMALERLAPDARAAHQGAHYLRLEGMDENQLRAEYDAICAVETIQDPIPSHMS